MSRHAFSQVNVFSADPLGGIAPDEVLHHRWVDNGPGW